MKTPKRIPILLKLLEKIWLQNPDLRLGQLIGNLENSYYIKDKDLITALNKIYEKR
jgi:hypothetical protein